MGILVLLFSVTVNAASKEITCSYKWKNGDAIQNQFSFKVDELGTSKAKVVVTANEDGEKVQVISGITESKHEADIMLREVGIDHPAEVFTSAKGDISIQIGDGVSSEIFIKVYKNSNYTAGFITVHCDKSDCGKFDFYSKLKCK